MKNLIYNYSIAILLFITIGLLVVSCSREDGDIEPASFPSNSDVFLDGFTGGLEYLPFAGSKLDAFTVETDDTYEGSAAMRFDVPNVGDPDGSFAGAIFPIPGGRNLTDYNALTFWARGSQSGTINEIGFGNDFGENNFLVTANNLQLSTNWKKYVIPIPDASKLTQERGLFWYSEGPEDEKGYSFWIDELQFENLSTITQPSPSIFEGQDLERETFTGSQIQISSLQQTFNLESGIVQTVTAAPAYFTFTSSNPSVAEVNETGLITVLGSGSTTISATLGGISAAGSITLNSAGQFTSAPMPSTDPADVISIFSDSYSGVSDLNVGAFNGANVQIQTQIFEGNQHIIYEGLDFVGISWDGTVDVSAMTHVHLDVQLTNSADAIFIAELIDFGPNDSDDGLNGTDDTAGGFDASSQLEEGSWVSIDIPLNAFTNGTGGGGSGSPNLSNIGYFVLVSNGGSFFVDNIYFYNDSGSMTGGDTEPTAPAPTPTQNAIDVISLFSDAYSDVTVDTWRTDWSSTEFEDVMIVGDPTKKYSNLDFVGIETVSNTVDASQMTHLHLDIWSPNITQFGIKLVDFGDNDIFDGGDDTEHQVDIVSPGQGEWVSLDIPLSDFTGLTTRSNIAQYIVVGQPTGTTTLFVDNFFFYNEGGISMASEPSAPAPTPVQDPANVISLFSDAYTDVTIDTWRTDWSAATFEDVTIGGDPTKKYSDLDFVGIESVTNMVDISSMSHLHMDIWSADLTLLGIKLVDFGPDGTFGGNDDSEHQINLDNINQGEWVSLDITLDDFEGLTSRSNISQYIIVGQPTGTSTVFIDNIYFYGDGSNIATEPTMAAPTPTVDAENVISLYSDAYTDVSVDTWRTDWSVAELEDITIDGNETKKYSNLDFVGIETVMSTIDATEMTHFSIDIWSADYTFFGIKLVDFGADGAFGGDDDVEHQINMEMLEQGKWTTFDILLTDFQGLTTTSNIAQLILVSQPTGTSTIYADNIFFRK